MTSIVHKFDDHRHRAGIRQGLCSLEVHRHQDFTLVIVSDLPGNEAPGITNWGTHLATGVLPQLRDSVERPDMGRILP